MNRRSTAGRDLSTLARDFGHTYPALAPAPTAFPDRDPFSSAVGRHGRTGAAAGWSPVEAPLAAYRMTSEQTGGVWPLIAGDALPSTGAPMGIDYFSGGAFHADPIGWTLNETAGVTNPNLIIFGGAGRGKSATTKMLSSRLMPYGYKTLVLGDVKDEYEDMSRAYGVTPHVIGPGLAARVNPLDFGPLGNDWTHLPAHVAQERATVVFARWLTLLEGLVGSQGVSWDPTMGTAVEHVVRDFTGYATGATRLTEITIPQVWHGLNNPTGELVADCRYANTQHFLDETRSLRDAFANLVSGPLAGLFDAATTVKVDWQAPIQTLSLSALSELGDRAVGIALTCLNSWGRAMTALAEPGDLRLVIRDECWKQMRLGVEAVKSLDADLRLSRKEGQIQVVVAHKPSDMLTVGAAGSQAVAIAKDLMHLCATKVLFGQDKKIAEELADLLELPPMAEQLVHGWATAGKGRALWIVGNHYAKVQAVRTPLEADLTFTNEALVRADA